MSVLILHNPRCSKSRRVLEMIREAGIEPEVIRYLEAPPRPARLAALLEAAGLTARQAMRRGEAAYAALGLDDAKLSEAQLIEAMCAHPALIERPLVETAKGVRLCRPPEVVLEIL